MEADVIVVGAGLAGLVAATEATDARRRVLLLDQEPEQSLGGQAFWSLGGLFMVDTPEQRRLRVTDSIELARDDWSRSAAFDRDTDVWAQHWAEAYLLFAHHEKRAWLRTMAHRLFPVVGWAERGDGSGEGHGNSVPRFHITWGTGPRLVELFERKARRAVERGLLTFGFRHRVDELIVEGGAVVGVRGAVLEPSGVARGVASSRVVVGSSEHRAPAVVVTSGGIGGNLDLVRKAWPARLGTPPARMVAGVPAHVDGRMLGIAEQAGARVVNRDRMWHYCEGLRNWDPIWDNHGIRILPGPSSLWLDAAGNRLPAPCYPGWDTLETLRVLRRSGYDYSWFVLTQKVIEKEFALSGSEQNPDLTGRDLGGLVRSRLGKGAPAPVEAFKRHGEDFVVADSVEALVAGMNAKADPDVPGLSVEGIRGLLERHDRNVFETETLDKQLQGVRRAREYLGDKLIRTAKPHEFLDPANGPLIAVRLNILTRKTLGGLQTDLSAQCLGTAGAPIPGLFAAGEASGFGGGGMHGYNALEGTFLGGCLFSGRIAGRNAAG
ncbi:MAG: FAD-binding dehydrogenase [Micropruina sp.]|nr:MAG: FAD-binding dehydrogenase [Micropruina sp.]